MQTTAELLANPFSLMMNPTEVFDAIERSDRLARLQSRVCRPLDKPLIAKKEADMNDYDQAIDAEPEADVETLEDLGVDLSDIVTKF